MKLFPFLFLSLAACQAPHVETRIQTVYCVTPEQYKKLVDAEPGLIRDQLTGNAQKDFKLVAGQAVALRSYSDGLLGVIGNCIGRAP